MLFNQACALANPTVAPFHLESGYLMKPGGTECLHTLPQELFVLG